MIELIAVLVILGLLAGVMASRYLDLAEQARNARAQQAFAEAVVRFNLAFLRYAADTQSAATKLEDLVDAGYLQQSDEGKEDAGDYRFTYQQTTSGGVSITVETRTGDDSWETLVDSEGTVLSRTVPWP